MKILFVCTGNICRSLMAATLARKLAADKGLEWETRSAGVAAESFYRVPREIRDILKDRIGADVSTHAPRLVTEDWVDWADRIFVMEKVHRAIIADRFPQAARKTALLDPSKEVADPMGGTPEEYAACYDHIHARLTHLLTQ